MEALLPILLIFTLFPLSLFAGRRLKMPFGLVLPCAAVAFFLVIGLL